MDPETHGVIIGRFMPPHAGHQYLVDFGRNMCDRLTVLVCTLSAEPIPGELRYRWMQELFPDVHMVHITEEIPEASKDSPTAIPIWAETVRAYLEAAPTYVFASEDYGAPLAAELGARFVPVDPARRQFPVSATMIRENPLANWDYIPEPVRPYFLRRVSVVEPGGAGAGNAGAGGAGAAGRDAGASLAQRLAAHYRTLYVSDYGAFWERTMGEIGPGELSLVQAAQQAVEDSLARRASRVLFCESDALRIAVSRGLEVGPGGGGEGRGADGAGDGAAGRSRGHDLTLLVEATGRAAGATPIAAGEDSLLDRMEAELRRRGEPFARIGATSEHELLDRAVTEVERVLGARTG
ncbi:MAG: adenylyltransferase/cytidyltransferase family protein [Spirochaetes bacterium]|jgi:NadR type nicotinamide-nucleotide adenylyltransferase|nr:adenylyltransferase/cytidyltransferase family protein [Spirochaetota bacterium]